MLICSSFSSLQGSTSLAEAMMGRGLFLPGMLSPLFLAVTCQAHDLSLGHTTSGANSLCEKETESWGAIFSEDRLDAWICSLIGSVMVGLSGVLPLLIIPLETGAALKSEGRPSPLGT